MLVLIEGLDLSGKSTVAKQLRIELENVGLSVQSGYGALHKNRLHTYVHDDLCHQETGGIWYIFMTNFLLTLLPLVDRVLFISPSWHTIVIHESYACRTIAFNKAHRIPFFHRLLTIMYPIFVSFNLTIYITASAEARKKRLVARAARNSDDLISITNPDLLLEMDGYLRNALKTCKNVLTIDNSELTIEDTVSIAKHAVIEHYNSRQ